MRYLRVLAVLAATLPLAAQTTPKQQFGSNIGDDYFLATYAQLTEYWQKLAKESNRMKLVDIGATAEGRRQYMAVISSPANLAKLDHYREISAKLAHAEGVSEAEAHALAREGDGRGLAAVERLGMAAQVGLHRDEVAWHGQASAQGLAPQAHIRFRYDHEHPSAPRWQDLSEHLAFGDIALRHVRRMRPDESS